MLHDPLLITTQAKELLIAYGDQAEEFALQEMFNNMNAEDISGAVFWLSVIEEIQKLAKGSKQLN